VALLLFRGTILFAENNETLHYSTIIFFIIISIQHYQLYLLKAEQQDMLNMHNKED